MHNLVDPALVILRAYPPSDTVIVRLAAGINDLTTFTRDETRRFKVLKPSAHTVETFMKELIHFKQVILNHRPQNTIVSFVTIPTASFQKFQASRKVPKPVISDTDLEQYQQDFDSKLDTINNQIITLNSDCNVRTLSWHNSVRKSAKRKHSTGVRSVKRNHFAHLYDGLHATSKLKRRWYSEAYKAFSIDRADLSCNQYTGVTV